jgi:hypothetical protein
MPDLNLRPVQSSQTSSASSSKPIPAPSILKPWQFSYASSPDGKDLNLLIMFHGLGTSCHIPSSLPFDKCTMRTDCHE